MAVYTEVSDDAAARLSGSFTTSGEATSFKGIAEGVENSNFLMRTLPAASGTSSPSTRNG